MWRSLAVCWLICVASAAWAASWTAVSADFQRASGTLERIDAQGIAIRQRDGLRELPWKQVLLLRQENVTAPAQPEPFVLFLRNGQRLAGRPVAMTADALTWRSSVGETTVPLQKLRGWARTGEELPTTKTDDLLVLVNGDRLTGIVDAAGDGLSLDHGQGAAKVQWDMVRSVTLSEVGEAAEATGGLLVKLADGSVLQATQVSAAGQKLSIAYGVDQQLAVDVDGVTQIENRQSEAVLLAWQTPQSATYTPYLEMAGQTPAPAFTVRDEYVVGPRVYIDVLVVRPRTVLVYKSPLDGELFLQYAAAAPTPVTDMALTVRVGEKPPLEKTGINSTEPGDPLRIPVGKGDTVTIEVNYGANLDAGDEMVLLNAALIRR